MEGRRIEVSATQVIASVLAAVTGAIAASTLGVAGTIIGTAVMSVASTAIASIYKHYISRSRERLRKAAEAAKASERAATFRGRHGTAGAHAVTRTAITNSAADADKTQVFPTVGATQHRWQDADRANGVGRLDDATRTAGRAAGAAAAAAATGAAWAREDDATGVSQVSPAAARRDTGERAADVTGHAGPPSGGDDESGLHGGNGGPAEEAAGQPRWRRPLALAGIAIGIFVLAMAGITAFEAIAGKPLDAVVGGKHSSGTTIGSLVGGQGSHTTSHHTGRSPAPSPSSTPTPSPSSSPGTSPSPSTSPSPTPSPTPTPAGTSAPTAGTTAGANAGAAADTPAAARRPATPTPTR
jgi:hypothetical protein